MPARLTALIVLLAALAAPTSALAITGGQPASRAYPHMAALTDGEGEWAGCGASIVRPGWALTAAHCAAGAKPSELGVRVGTQDLTGTGGETIGAKRVIVHERWESEDNEAASAYDVALLELQRPVSQATPIRIPSPAEKALWAPGRQATVTGWGGTFFPGIGGLNTTEEQLHEVAVPMVSDEECGRYLYRFDDPVGLVGKFDPVTMVCAGERTGGADSCNGDSGGPLVVADATGALVQVGVVSWGTGCGYPLSYGVYARIADTTLFDWIQSKLPSEQPAASASPTPAAATPAQAPAAAPAPAGQVRTTTTRASKSRRLTKAQRRCVARANRLRKAKWRKAARQRCLAPRRRR